MHPKSFPRLTSKALRILGACDNEFLSSQEVAIRAGMEGEGLTAWVGAHDREVRAQWRGKTKKDSYWALADLAEQGDAFTASLVDLGYVDLSKEGKRVLIRITPLGREALQALQVSHPAQIFEGTDDGSSLSDEATFAGEMQGELHSLGDRSTLGGADGSSVSDLFRLGDGPEHQMEIGDLSQRYRIEKSLGHGGMGEVLLAVDSRLDRRVAIKRIRSDKAAGKTASARFSQEAKAVASLSHPNIVAVHDYGRDSQGPFLIMEYVSGGSLLQRCKQGKIEFDDAINLVCQLCDGLGHAHDAGIIHRDIKPANILLTDSGIPKLTDFGLAKADARDHTMTMDGAVLGTLDFMPPEQRMSAALTDCRSDLWSLAASFYQMITGDSPKVINLDHVPRKVRGVLAKALQSDIESRFASALEMREALANAKFSLKSFATPPVSLEVGECIICSTENPLEKKYCRECGARLIANCLSCDESINVWDKACGQCGSKQDTLIEKKTNAFLKDMEEATLLRQDLKFTDALSKLQDSLLTDDPRFINATHAAKEFATSVEREQAELEASASKRLEAAQRFYANRMYSEANAEIQKIPEAFRTGTAVELVNSISKIQAEVNQLLNELRSEETEVAFAKMMPKVTRLEELTSVTDEINGFREAILDTIERHQRLRVEIATDAKQAYEAYHFEEVLEVISRAPESLIDEWEEISAVRKVSRDQLTEIEDLKKRIGELEGNQPIDYENLLALTRKLCDLMPNDTGLGKNLNALVARVNQVHTEDRTLMDQAATHSRNHEYQKALSCYAKLQSKLFCERAHGPRVAAQKAKDQVLELDKMITASLPVADWVATKNLLGQYLQLAPANSFYLELTEEIEILIEAASIEATDLHRADELLNRISLPVLCSHRDSMKSRIDYKINEKEDLHKRIMSFDYLSNKQARLDLIARYLAIDSQNDEMRELAESLTMQSDAKMETGKPRRVAMQQRRIAMLFFLLVIVAIALVTFARRSKLATELTMPRSHANYTKAGDDNVAGGADSTDAHNVAVENWLPDDSANPLLDDFSVQNQLTVGEESFETAEVQIDLSKYFGSDLSSNKTTIVNAVGMKFNLIPRGSFTMGSPELTDAPSHMVRLTESFYLGVYEVTQAEYEQVMGSNPSNFKAPQNPVEQVTWDEAMEFCRKLAALPIERAAGRTYRLPTEAEWEYACRAGSTIEYGFGHASAYAWLEGNSGGRTHPVGQKQPNDWGLYDMHGNVWEWCYDLYGEYNASLDITVDPVNTEFGFERVTRGGSWFNSAKLSRSSNRNRYPSDNIYSTVGFRVVCEKQVHD